MDIVTAHRRALAARKLEDATKDLRLVPWAVRVELPEREAAELEAACLQLEAIAKRLRISQKRAARDGYTKPPVRQETPEEKILRLRRNEEEAAKERERAEKRRRRRARG